MGRTPNPAQRFKRISGIAHALRIELGRAPFMSEVQERAGCSRQNVSVAFKSLGLDPREANKVASYPGRADRSRADREIRDARDALILPKLLEGKRHETIALELGLSRRLVAASAKRCGIIRRHEFTPDEDLAILSTRGIAKTARSLGLTPLQAYGRKYHLQRKWERLKKQAPESHLGA